MRLLRDDIVGGINLTLQAQPELPECEIIDVIVDEEVVDPPYNVVTKKTQSRLALVYENILIILDPKEKRQGEVLVVLSLFVRF